MLAGWGHGLARKVRAVGGAVVRLRPRRSRCLGCGTTHILLPVGLLVRRADTAAVVGGALSDRARGLGYRRIAAGNGRPPETVRGWLRRFAGRLEAVRAVFTRLVRAVSVDPVVPGPASGPWADALVVIMAAFRGAQDRFGVFTVRVWDWVTAVSSGQLLAPGWPAGVINTS